MVDGKDNFGGANQGDENTKSSESGRLGVFDSKEDQLEVGETNDFTIDLDRATDRMPNSSGSIELQEGVGLSESSGMPDAMGAELEGVDMARGGLVAARGTVDGLVIRVDGRLEPGAMRQALDEFVSARSSFLSGQEVFLEWVGMRPSPEVEQSLSQLLTKSYGIAIKSVRLFSRARSASSQTIGAGSETLGARTASGLSVGGSDLRTDKKSSGGSGLFGGVRSIGREVPLESAIGHPQRTFQSPLSGSTLPWDEPDTRLIHATLRSGQKLESEHSLVIVGDVNSGAEVTSGGDIVILGTLRGVAHAGAYEESGGGRVIFALNMQPTQLRIGAVISRGATSEGIRSQDGKSNPEVARVDGTLIIVEQYQTKTLGPKLPSGRASASNSTVGLLGRKRGAA